VRTNSRMPDILAIGLGGGTRVHLDPTRYAAEFLDNAQLRIGPDSVGFRILEEACLFGGATLTTSDVAVAAGVADFGDHKRLPMLSRGVQQAVMTRLRQMLEEGVDRMKTSREPATILAVGGGAFLIPETLKGVGTVIRPAHAAVANAVGAAIAQVGAQVEQLVSYDTLPREQAMERLRAEAFERVVAAGGDAQTLQVVEVEEVFLSYLPGRAAQLRLRAVADLAGHTTMAAGRNEVRHAH